MGVEYLDLNEANTRSIFETMFRQNNLIPVLGAGFSKGAQTPRGRVPDGEETRAIMLDALRAHLGHEVDELIEADLATISGHFLNPKLVPSADVKGIIEKYFLNVTLDQTRRSFLECPWPYVYTLNIDDAIERNSRFTQKIVPNRQIADITRAMKCVYKVHGDATDELLYNEPSKIIFSTPQYVRSLTKNTSMLTFLKTELTEQNTIFVGCSLANEIDLLFALAEYQGSFIQGRKSIFVTTRALNRFDEATLEGYGINTILRIANYEVFYKTISEWGHSLSSLQISSNITQFETSQSVHRLGKDRESNLSFLIRDPKNPDSGDTRSLPSYYVERDLEEVVMQTSTETTLVLLRGRRFSGRTLMLRSIALRTLTKNVYYFNSDTRMSSELIEVLVVNQNSLFLFDTNTLTAETAALITRASQHFKAINSCAIIAVNRTEPDVIGSVVAHVEDRADLELEARLSQIELEGINKRLNALGLLRFESGRTLLENTYRILSNSPGRSSTLIDRVSVNDREFELLLIISVGDKAFSSLATALDIRIGELHELCARMSPLLDLIEVPRSERLDTHSRFKVVTNSTTGLGLFIRSCIRHGGYEWLAARFAELVRRLIQLPSLKAIGHSMFMFDAVNHVLSLGGGTGAGYKPVVRELYSALQTELSDSPDYWLQRAKAVLKVEDDSVRLIEGIEFATKALREAERERTADNAEFLIALLYGKLCIVGKYLDSSHVISAVEWFAQAIRNFARNPNYVRAMLDQSKHRKGSFDLLCDYLTGPISDVKLLAYKRDVDFLLSTRRTIGVGRSRQ
jgi:hypothetical protein